MSGAIDNTQALTPGEQLSQDDYSDGARRSDARIDRRDGHVQP